MVLNKVMPEKVAQVREKMGKVMMERWGVPLLGVVPEGDEVLKSTNIGRPVILMDDSNVGLAYQDLVRRFLGEDCELRFLAPKSKGIMGSIFGK